MDNTKALEVAQPIDAQFGELVSGLTKEIKTLRAQLAESDAQLVVADRLLQRTVNATACVVRHDNLRRDIRDYQRTRQPKEGA